MKPRCRCSKSQSRAYKNGTCGIPGLGGFSDRYGKQDTEIKFLVQHPSMQKDAAALELMTKTKIPMRSSKCRKDQQKYDRKLTHRAKKLTALLKKGN